MDDCAGRCLGSAAPAHPLELELPSSPSPHEAPQQPLASTRSAGASTLLRLRSIPHFANAATSPPAAPRRFDSCSRIHTLHYVYQVLLCRAVAPFGHLPIDNGPVSLSSPPTPEPRTLQPFGVASCRDDNGIADADDAGAAVCRRAIHHRAATPRRAATMLHLPDGRGPLGPPRLMGRPVSLHPRGAPGLHAFVGHRLRALQQAAAVPGV